MGSQVGLLEPPAASPRAMQSFGAAEGPASAARGVSPSLEQPPHSSGPGLLTFLPSFVVSRPISTPVGGSEQAPSSEDPALPSPLKLSLLVSPVSRHTQSSQARLVAGQAAAATVAGSGRALLGNTCTTSPGQGGSQHQVAAAKGQPTALPGTAGTSIATLNTRAVFYELQQAMLVAEQPGVDQQVGEDGAGLPPAPAQCQQEQRRQKAEGPGAGGGPGVPAGSGGAGAANERKPGVEAVAVLLSLPATQVALPPTMPEAPPTQVLAAEGTQLLLPQPSQQAGSRAGMEVVSAGAPGEGAPQQSTRQQQQEEFEAPGAAFLPAMQFAPLPGPEEAAAGEEAMAAVADRAGAAPNIAMPAGTAAAAVEKFFLPSDAHEAGPIDSCGAWASDAPAAAEGEAEQSPSLAAAAAAGAADTVPSPLASTPGVQRASTLLQVCGLPAVAGVPPATPLGEQLGSAEALVEAELLLRLQCLGYTGPTPATLGGEGTQATGASWVPSEGVTQYQSLEGANAEAQAEVVGFARAFREGNTSHSLRSAVCSEVVLGISKALLGPDYLKLPVPVTDRWQWVMWREFKKHGLDAGLCYEGGGQGLGPGELLLASEAEEAEAQGCICSEEELLERRQQLATYHSLAQLRPHNRHMRRLSTPAATSGPDASPAGASDAGMTRRMLMPDSVNPAGLPVEAGAQGDRQLLLALSGGEMAVGVEESRVRQELVMPALMTEVQDLLGGPQDGGASELDIHPTLVSAPSPPPPLRAQLQTGGGVSQLEVPSTLCSLQPPPQPALAGPDSALQLGMQPTLASPLAQPGPAPPLAPGNGGAAGIGGVSQLDIQPTLLSAPQPMLLSTSEAALGSNGGGSAPDQQQQEKSKAADPFDALFNSHPQFFFAPEAKSQFPGSWWFSTNLGPAAPAGAGDAVAGSPDGSAAPAAGKQAAAAAALLAAFPPTAVVLEAEPAPQPAADAAAEQAQHGVPCSSMVPDTPPHPPSPSSNSAPHKSPGAGTGASPPVPTSPAAGAAPAAAGAAAQGGEPPLLVGAPRAGVSVPLVAVVPDSEDIGPSGSGGAAPKLWAPPSQPAAGSLLLPPAPPPEGAAVEVVAVVASQAVDDAAVRRAMEVVGRISDDFPATQDLPLPPQPWYPTAQVPPLPPVEGAAEVQAQPAPVQEPPPQQQQQAAPEVAGRPAQGIRQPPAQLPSPTKRRWKPNQGVAIVDYDSEEGAADQEMSGQSGRKWSREKQPVAKPTQGGKKPPSRSERRRELTTERMAPAGFPRPDLGASLPLSCSPGLARRAAAAAAAASSPQKVAQAAASPAAMVKQAAAARRRASNAAAAGEAANVPCSGLLDDIDLFATQLPRAAPSPAGGMFGFGTKLSVGAAATWGPRTVDDAGGRNPLRFPSSNGTDSAPVAPPAHLRRASVGVPRLVSLAGLHSAKGVGKGFPPGAAPRSGPARAGSGPEGSCRQSGQHQQATAQQQEEEEQQLLVIEGPHPLIQTLPEAGGTELLAAARAAGLLRGQQGQGQGGTTAATSRPARNAQLPARYRRSPGEEQEPGSPRAGRPLAASPCPAVQQQAVAAADGEAVAQPSRARKRAATPAGRASSGKKFRRTPNQQAAVAAPDGRQPQRQQEGECLAPETEEQCIAEVYQTKNLGCSKCRYSENGCGKCRGEREAHIKSIVEAQGAGLPPPAASPTSASQRSLGAAATAGALLSASPSPCGAGVGNRRGGEGSRAARARQGQQQQQPEDDQELPSQEIGGPPSPPRRQAQRQAKGGAKMGGAAVQLAAGVRRKSSGATERHERVFAGVHFLVTGFAKQAEQKRALLEQIRAHGGAVMDEVPPLPTAQGRRQTLGGHPSAAAITAVLCDSRLRTPKFLYAVIKGIPVLKPSWVESCIAAGRQLPAKREHLVHPLPATGTAPAAVFAGVRVHLYGGKPTLESFAQLLRHAGALIAPSLEAEAHATVGGAGRAGAQTGATCDVVLLDTDDESPAGAAGVSSLRRLARRLDVPVYDRKWAIDALLKGRLPDDFPLLQNQQRQEEEAAATPRLLGKGTPVPVHQQSSSSQGGWAGTGPTASRGGEEQPEQEGSALAVPRAAGAGAGTCSSPRGRKRGRGMQQAPRWQQRQQQQEEGEVELAPRTRRRRLSLQGDAPAEQQQQQVNSAGGSGGAFSPEAIAWVGEPQAPPPGLPSTAFRSYYAAFRKGEQAVALGDCVELAAAPGEDATRLAQVQVLWAERTPDGRERMMMRCRRYYRPSETEGGSFADIAAPNEIFLVDHIEERVALAAVLRRCTLLAAVPPTPAHGSTYICRFRQFMTDMGPTLQRVDGTAP